RRRAGHRSSMPAPERACRGGRLHLPLLLRSVPRRYRLPEHPGEGRDAAASISRAIEQARLAMEDGTTPDPALQTLFLDALARLIRDAMRPDPGDPAFQAMVLRHRMPHVREYASLSADAEQDRRRVRALINPYPHPDRHRLARAALARLQRRNALRNDTWVQRYEALWRRHGPPSGSTGARLDGEASRRRGAAMESRAAQAIEALAQRLEADSEEGTRYSVVTSLHVPASIDTPRARA